MVLAPRTGRTAVAKQPVAEVLEMAHGWAAQGEGVGGGASVEGVPRAIFVPHANSLPFEERCVSVEQSVKIGRNVCKAAPTPTNAIFECRVLSRHHATLWYEKGHFYIMDNQSSNGTFINNNRCSIGKDSEPHEVFSGDMLQFGIAVVENHTDHEKNTFLPVVALLKLYHPDGKEAKLVFNPAMTTPLHLKELYQLNNYLQEAVSREAVLESRLKALQESVQRTRASALSGWELLVGEQRLLARVHALEARLAGGKAPADRQLQELLQDKANYQEVAQESLRQAHEQRLALEEALEKKGREAYALRQQNCDLRLTADRALGELQKLAARCERKISAAKIAIASAEDREASTRARVPLAISKINGEMRMLVVSSDSGRLLTDEAQSLADAVLKLPDYIKLLLPDKILSQVGLKAISIDPNNAKECSLILKKNDLSDVENRDKRINDSEPEWLQDNCHREDTQNSAEEKNGLTNHDDTELDSVADAELNSDAPFADNNANSTYRRVVDNHNDVQSVKKEELVNGALHGLGDEVTALRSRLAELSHDNERLRHAVQQLLHVKLEVEEEINERLMLERALTDPESDPDSEKHDPESHKELEARLERALAAERELADQLAARPSPDLYSELTLTCEKLQEELHERDSLLEQLRQTPSGSTTTLVSTCDRSVNTAQLIHLDEISALNELDDALEEFNCDEAEERDLDIDVDLEEALANLDAVNEEHGDGDAEKAEGENLEKEAPKESALEESASETSLKESCHPEGSMKESGISVTSVEDEGADERVVAMQEELVRVKESWAAARAELATLQAARSGDARAQVIALAVALLALALYALLYRYAS